jgi:hypothetical protein
MILMPSFRPLHLSAVWLGLALLTLSCNREHEACISLADPTFVCPGIPIVFTNCGDPDDSYSWSFGDGNGSKELSPTYTYLSRDTMKIRLDAGSKKKKDTDSLTVIVAHPKAKALRLNAFPALAPDGGTWDPNGSGPDLRLWIFDENGSTLFNSAAITNVVAGQSFDMGGQEFCGGCTWRLMLLDTQVGGNDPDTLYFGDFSYEDLAKTRISTHSMGGVSFELEFFPH